MVKSSQTSFFLVVFCNTYLSKLLLQNKICYISLNIINFIMQCPWFSWIKENNMHRTRIIFWVHTCGSCSKRSDCLGLCNKIPSNHFGTSFVCAKEEKKKQNKAQTKAWKNHSVYKGAGRKREVREGQKVFSWQPCEIWSGQRGDTRVQWEPEGYKVIFPHAWLHIITQCQHTRNAQNY